MLGHHGLLMAGGGGGAPSILAKLVSFWEFQNTPADVHGANPFGGTLPYTSGVVGQAAESGKAKTSGAVGVANPLTGGCSIFGWVKPSSSPTARILFCLGQFASSGESVWTAMSPATGFQAGMRDASSAPFSYIGPGAIAHSSWYFVVTNVTATHVELWIGNSLIGSVARPPSVRAYSFFAVGSVLGTASGAVTDQMGYTNGPLTAPEINWLYNGGAGRAYSEM